MVQKDIKGDINKITQKVMEEKGYKVDATAYWCMELYNCPRFTIPMENGEIILDYYIPYTLPSIDYALRKLTEREYGIINNRYENF
jgi:hypothetical protein